MNRCSLGYMVIVLHILVFWEELFDIRGYWASPWIVGGDSNVIRFSYEKNVGSRVMRSMRDFRTFVNDCALRDCPMLNAKFTWTNGQDQPIMCHLDRFLVSFDWEELYPRFIQECLPKLLQIIGPL